jgi:hypothetical protein
VAPTTGEIPAGDETFVPESTIALGGRFAAALNYSCLEGCGSQVVEVYDLRLRRRVRSIETDWGTAVKVLLGARGGVAIVEDADGLSQRRSIIVRDSRGLTDVTIGPRGQLPVGSLRVDGNLLRWMQAGVEHAFEMR